MEKTLILVVDDDDTKRYVVNRTLQRAGYQIIEASTGLEALERVAEHPALIVLDVKLPDLSGFEVCRRLKENPETSAIPVLHLSSSFRNSSDKIHGLNLGADGYLAEPVEPEELIANIRALIRLRMAEGAAKEAAEQLKVAYKEQKRIAEQLQRSLLIKVPENAFVGVQVATFYEAAWDEASVGGDFYDIFPVPGEKLALAVGDAAGKGLVAATRTAEVKYALRAFMHEYADPAQAITRLNDFLCDSYHTTDTGEMVIALSTCLVDTHSGEITFACAGAEPPLVLRGKDGPMAVEARGLPLGVFHSAEYLDHKMSWEDGDTIMMATDGITEARRGADFLSYEGMAELAKKHLAGNDSVRQEGQAIVDAARDYAGGKFQDDVCVLVARCQTDDKIENK